MRLTVKNIYDQLHDTVDGITNMIGDMAYLSMLTYKFKNTSVVYVGITIDYRDFEHEPQLEVLVSSHQPRYPGFLLYHASLGVRMFTTDTTQLI